MASSRCLTWPSPWTKLEKILGVVGVALAVFGLVSDVLVAAEYYDDEEYSIFVWTLAFLIVPAVIASALSMIWECREVRRHTSKTKERGDEYKERKEGVATQGGNQNKNNHASWLGLAEFFLGPLKKTSTTVTPQAYLWHMFLLSGMYRELRCLFATNRRLGKEKGLEDMRDAGFLGLIVSFLEDAPQVVLQVTIVTKRHELTVLQVFSILTSVASLAWAIVKYSTSLRKVNNRFNPQKYFVLTWSGQFCMWVWRVSMVGSRILAMSLFFNVYGVWLVLVGVVHWLGMFWWLLYQQTIFCHEYDIDNIDAPVKNRKRWEKCLETLFDLLVAAVSVFGFLNVKLGKTRWRITSYYVIVFLENSILGILWYMEVGESERDSYRLALALSIWALFAHGLLWMAIYYSYTHPQKQYHTAMNAAEKFIFAALSAVDAKVLQKAYKTNTASECAECFSK
eukprot:m.57506 g.57506  ORF g.57506 m.57506 type:complete len:453 (+) comp34752_c1_seq2:184-1542(+)